MPVARRCLPDAQARAGIATDDGRKGDAFCLSHVCTPTHNACFAPRFSLQALR